MMRHFQIDTSFSKLRRYWGFNMIELYLALKKTAPSFHSEHRRLDLDQPSTMVKE